MLFVLRPCVCVRRHFEPNGTHWNQVGSKYTLSVPSPTLNGQGYSIKISSDGLSVMMGHANPTLNAAMAGDAAVFARASTALVGGTSQPQFELRVRHVVAAEAGEVMGAAAALSGDGTQVALGGQHTCSICK
jgi:hypothetical protein